MKKLILLLLMIPNVGYSGPGPDTKSLMNTPASLFDVGLLRLEIAVNSAFESTRHLFPDTFNGAPVVGVTVDYSPKHDLIYVRVGALRSKGSLRKYEEACRTSLEVLRPHILDFQVFMPRSHPKNIHLSLELDKTEKDTQAFYAAKGAVDRIVLGCQVQNTDLEDVLSITMDRDGEITIRQAD